MCACSVSRYSYSQCSDFDRFELKKAALDCHLLRHGWKYYNIWWNDVDFALLLAYLVIGARTGTKCTTIMKRFNEMRYKEVIEPRGEACGKVFMACCWLGVVSSIAATGGLAAPLVPVISTVTGFSSIATVLGLGVGGEQRFKQRQEACRNLVKRIPKLKGFFSGVGEEYSNLGS